MAIENRNLAAGTRLEANHKKARDTHSFVQDWTGPFELPEADVDAVRQTRELIDLWAENRG